MFIKREPLRAESDAFIHLQRRHPVRIIPVNRKRQMEEILHLPFVIEVDLCDVHEKCSSRSLTAGRTELHCFCAVSHLIAEIVRVFVYGENCAEIKEEAQAPCHGTDEDDGGL